MPTDDMARFLICLAMLAQSRRDCIRQADLQLSATGFLSAQAIETHGLMMAAINNAEQQLICIYGRQN